MHFGIALELPDIDLWDVDLLDTYLDLLDTDFPTKYFVCLHSVFKTPSRHVFKTSSRHVFKTSSRRLQRNNFSSSKTYSRRLARCLQDVLEDGKLLRWRRLQDQQMFAGKYFILYTEIQNSLYWKRSVFLRYR